MVSQKIMDRVAKLFALAKRAGSQAEAENAMLRARELLLKYGLSEADFDCSEDEAEAKSRTVYQSEVTNKVDKCKKILASTIAPYFRCRVLTSINSFNRTARLIIVGFKTDVEILSQTLDFTFNSFPTLYKSRLKSDIEYQSASTKEKHSLYYTLMYTYLQGFCKGISEKFEAQNQQSDIKDLVVVTPPEVNDFVDGLRPSSRAISCKVKKQSAMSLYGYMDGKSLQKDKCLDYFSDQISK